MHKHIHYALAIGMHSEAHRGVGSVAADVFIYNVIIYIQQITLQ